MITSNSLLTRNSKLYEITNYYYSTESLVANTNINSLYSYISYKPSWNVTILESTVDNTKLLKTAGILESSNTLFILNEDSIFDLSVGMTVETENGYLPENSEIVSIDYDNLSVILNEISANSYIGNTTFTGLDQTNLITINEANSTATLSTEIDYYKNCKLNVNVNGDLSYTRTITNYDPITQTLKVTPDFNDAPPITTSSSIRIYYDNDFPPKPNNTDKEFRDIYESLFYLKRISTTNICPVIERINWNSGTVYDYYSDSEDLSLKNSSGKLIKKFYIINQYFQVFKCLWNNDGVPSTNEPYFAPGIYDTTLNIFKGIDDGYKWKYMFTVPRDYVQKFMDDNWIPLNINAPADLNVEVNTNDTKGGGGIEVINVTDGGENYTYDDIPVVTITGDGTDAEAIVEISDDGSISDVIVQNAGKNYSYANIEITTSQYGSGANATAFISSIGGHGKDIVSELCCERLLVISYYDSLDAIPTDLQIRQHGILSGIVSSKSYPDYENSSYIPGSDSIIVAPGVGTYTIGEVVYQTNTTYDENFFHAICAYYCEANNKLCLTNVKGNYVLGQNIVGVDSGTGRQILIYTPSDMIKYSGRILSIENISEIERSADSIQIFKTLLKF